MSTAYSTGPCVWNNREIDKYGPLVPLWPGSLVDLTPLEIGESAMIKLVMADPANDVLVLSNSRAEITAVCVATWLSLHKEVTILYLKDGRYHQLHFNRNSTRIAMENMIDKLRGNDI